MKKLISLLAIATFPVCVALALTVLPAAQASTFTLKPGHTRSYRCHGNNACVKWMKDRRGIRLKRIQPGCWSHPWTMFESCTATTRCHKPRCEASNGSRVAIRVRLRT